MCFRELEHLEVDADALVLGVVGELLLEVELMLVVALPDDAAEGLVTQ